MSLTLYYDDEGDLFEISTGEQRGTFVEIQEGIFLCVDNESNEVSSIVIHCFKKRMGNCKDIALPFSIQMKSTKTALQT